MSVKEPAPTAPAKDTAGKEVPATAGNFLRNIVESDLAQGKYASRRWSGKPGDAAQHTAGPLDPARIAASLGVDFSGAGGRR